MAERVPTPSDGIARPEPARIAGVRGTVLSLPVQYPIVSAVRRAERVIIVLVEVRTRDGLTGTACVQGFSLGKARAICSMLDDLAEPLAGLDAGALGSAWDRLWAATTLAGHTGIAAFTLSAIDVALWDLHGKQLGVPLYRLLGGRELRTLPAYASDGCWLDSPTRVADQAAAFAAQGFDTVKIRFGRPNPEDDFTTLRAVRSAIGDGVRVIVDVNQGWSREQAQRHAARLEEFDVLWLEEPLAAEDVEGLAELRRGLRLPIAAGENAYMLDGVRALVEQRAVSILMPDLQRIGGVSGWLRASALAEAWRLPITSHLFPELCVHLLAASRTAGLLEWVSWLQPLLAEPLSLRGGAAELPQRPGLGLEIAPDAVRTFTV